MGQKNFLGMREIFHIFGKSLIIFGVILIFFGILLFFSEKIPFFGRLPGDIILKRKNFVFYFPLLTCILVSAIITILLNILRR